MPNINVCNRRKQATNERGTVALVYYYCNNNNNSMARLRGNGVLAAFLLPVKHLRPMSKAFGGPLETRLVLLSPTCP
jgi:hypothetical protein